MENLPLNALDIGVAVVILLSGLLALVRGFVKEMLSIGAWVGAALAALYAFPHVQPFARDLISVQIAADVTAGVSVFVVTLIILSGLTHWIASHVRQSHFSKFDRGLGFFFGLLRGAVVVCLLWLLVNWAIEPSKQPPWITEARSLPMIKSGAEILTALVPEDVRSGFEAQVEEAGKDLREAVESERDRRLDEVTTPTPDDTTPGYESEERENMNRQFESTE
jgi:membrane protein required for colicin V production